MVEEFLRSEILTAFLDCAHLIKFFFAASQLFILDNISLAVKVVSDHFGEFANQIHIIGDHGDEREEAERERGRWSRGRDYLPICHVV